MDHVNHSTAVKSSAHHIPWIDILRGLGTILVLFGHLSPAPFIEKHIYSFHMFLFFFVSGYIYSPSCRIHTEIYKNSIRLILPFLFWDITSSIVELAAGSAISDVLQRMILWDGQICWNAPIWFLLTLFFVKTLYSLIDHLNIRESQACVLVLSLVVGCFCNGHNLFLKVGTIPLSLFFYSLGAICHRYLSKIRKSQLFLLIAALICLVINLLCGLSNDRLSTINCYYGDYVKCILAGVSGVAFYSWFSRIVSLHLPQKAISALSYIGNHSLFLLCTQYYCFRLFASISISKLGNDIWHSSGTFKALTLSVFSLSLLLLVERILAKFLPLSLQNLLGVK